MSSPHRFVVRRQEWTPPDATGVRRLLPEKWARVAECRTAADADTKFAELLADARRTLNPFHLGGPCLFYQTSLPPHALHDFLMDGGLTPPANSLSSAPNYAFWWVKNNRTFTDAEREHVWTACDKLRLFDVVEEDDRQAAHVVMEKLWGDYGGGVAFEADEGGWPVVAYRRYRDAKETCRRNDEQHRAAEENSSFDWYGPPTRYERHTDANVYLTRHEAHFFKTESVSLAGEFGGSCYIVARQGVSGHGGYILVETTPEYRFNLGARVSLVALPDRASASDHLRHLTRRARRTLNPFAVAWSDNIYMWEQFPLIDVHNTTSRDLPNGLTINDAVDSVKKLDLTPPPPDLLYTTSEWVDWYDRVVQWSPEYLDVIWGTFADFRLFEVIEVPLH